MVDNVLIRTDTQYYFGTVKWFGGYNAKKECENDFGFIASEHFGDVFVHKTALKNVGSLSEDQQVVFTQKTERKGTSATSLYALSSFAYELSEILEPLSKSLKTSDNRDYAKKNGTVSSLLVNIFIPE